MATRRYLVFLLMLTPLYAAEDIEMTVDGASVRLERHATQRVTASKICFSSRKTCNALEALKTLSRRALQYPKRGGPDPGALLCQNQASGQVVTALTAHGNPISLCMFPDSSLISCASLAYAATQNDLKRVPVLAPEPPHPSPRAATGNLGRVFMK